MGDDRKISVAELVCMSFTRNGTWIISKEVWRGSGIDPDKVPLSYIN